MITRTQHVPGNAAAINRPGSVTPHTRTTRGGVMEVKAADPIMGVLNMMSALKAAGDVTRKRTGNEANRKRAAGKGANASLRGKVRITITKTNGNPRADADGPPGVARANMAGKTNGAAPVSVSGPRGGTGKTTTKKPTISAALTVRLAAAPALRAGTKAMTSVPGRKTNPGHEAGAITGTWNPKGATALPTVVILTLEKTSSAMKTTMRITVALPRGGANRGAASGKVTTGTTGGGESNN